MSHDIDRRMLLGTAGLAGIAAISASGRAGPLTPPAGAVAATGKTLADVEPRIAINATNTPGNATSVYRISQGGSYYLTGNVIFGPGKSAIEVSAGNVVIDLNGYLLTSLGGVSGVRAVDSTVARTAIRNGTIWNGTGAGIDFNDNESVIVENVMIESAEDSAIRIGRNGRISGCTIIECGGFNAGVVCTESVVESCLVRDCAGTGILAQSSVVRGCTAVRCAGTGIYVAGGGLAEACCSHSNGTGFNLYFSSATGCTALSNASTGYNIGWHCVADGCVASNTIGSGAGFLISGQGNNVRNNTSCNNGIGYRATAANNLLAGNVASGNTTNWNIAANNGCLVVASPANAAFTGDSGGVSPGSSNPWANFTM
jgi:hypothetical protein